MNQTSEQVARDHIDRQLLARGWQVQNKPAMNLAAGRAGRRDRGEPGECADEFQGDY